MMFKRIKIFFLLIFFFGLPFIALADSQGQIKTFFVNPDYDSNKNVQVQAILENVSSKGYFYLEKQWYEGLSKKEKEEAEQSLRDLSREFDENIYPKLTSAYGKEWSPGIDNNLRITILFEKMKKDAGGYFNSGDEYSKLQNPESNEREMVYLNAEYINSSLLRSFLAHEFTHLIAFNQKDRLRAVSDDLWLNEIRADYSSTLMGYDQEYQNSALQQRVRDFISSPSDSLTEWSGQKSDYGVANLFAQYLVGHYGVEILTDSLRSPKTGIASINYALKKNGFGKDFSQIFTDWTIAAFLNNCGFGEEYCYKNKNLKNFKISPSLIFLPSTQKTEVSLSYSIKQWAGHWYRIMGGEGSLELKFESKSPVQFKIPYVLCKDNQDCEIDFLRLDKNKKGEIFLENFSNDWNSLTIIPSIQSKISNFSEREPLSAFSLQVSMKMKNDDEKLVEKLKAQIEFLQKEIIKIQSQIAVILAERGQGISCGAFSRNLYFGIKNNSEVRCLQKFLKSQGSEIYPQGLITGYFGPMTKAAVIRFQEKYGDEILKPIGLEKGTGIFGPATRAKINNILN